MLKSLYDSVKVLSSLIPATRTSSANGDAVDTMGYNSVMAVIEAGNIDTVDADETYNFKLQGSADGSTGWADVSGATAVVTADNQVKLIRLDNLLDVPRYIRVVATLAGTTPSWPGSAIVLLGNAVQGPVNS